MSARTSWVLDDLRRLLANPVIAPLAERIRITVGPTREVGGAPAPFRVPEPDCLIVARPTLGSRAAAVHLRHGLELAWLLGEALAPPLAGLLSARTAALFLELEPADVRQLRTADPILGLLAPLAGACPHPSQLAALWSRLGGFQAAPLAPLEPWMAEQAAEYWRLVGPVEHLLATGGDTRIDLDPDTGLNRYGCSPRPRPEAASFASCTASSISEQGYRAAEFCRQRVLGRALASSPATALADEAHAIRAAILDHYGASELAEALLVPSGTDATLLTTGLLAASWPSERVTSILVSPAETGSGVPAAVRGRHFADRTMCGNAVAKGSAVAGFRPDLHLASVELRAGDGNPLPQAASDRAFAAAVEGALSHGGAVLHMVYGSKTGLVAPSFGLAAGLADRHRDRLDVVVDACQARIDGERVRACLGLGWPVLLTGSKFFGGPAFAGVVLFPRARLEGLLRAAPRPPGLADYLGSDGAGLLGLGGNLGLALRWAAALCEMRAFAALPARHVFTLLHRLGDGVRELLEDEAAVQLVPSPPATGLSWSDRQTIFAIKVRNPADPARWLSPSELEPILALMNGDLADRLSAMARGHALRRPYHLGQPVLIGGSPSGPIGAVRIAFGARTLRPALEASRPDAAVARIMGDIGDCIAKLTAVLECRADLAALPA